MDKWEYKKVNFIPGSHLANKSVDKDLDGLFVQLNELGQEGWEVVNVQSYDAGTKFLAILKRKIE